MLALAVPISLLRTRDVLDAGDGRSAVLVRYLPSILEDGGQVHQPTGPLSILDVQEWACCFYTDITFLNLGRQYRAFIYCDEIYREKIVL